MGFPKVSVTVPNDERMVVVGGHFARNSWLHFAHVDGLHESLSTSFVAGYQSN